MSPSTPRRDAELLGGDGSARAELRVAAATVRWGEQLEGTLRLSGGKTPFPLRAVDVHFYAWDGETSQDLSKFRLLRQCTLRPAEEIRREIACTVPWGTPLERVGVSVTIRSGWWHNQRLNVLVDVLPAADCEALAAVCAAETEMTLAGWRVAPSGLAGRERLRPEFQPPGPECLFRHAWLEIAQHEAGYRVVTMLVPRDSGLLAAPEREILFLSGDETEAREEFRKLLMPYRRRYGAAGSLPLPGGAPGGPAADLPLPARRHPDEPRS